MTHYHAVPASGDGIVILTNSDRSWPLIARILEDWGAWSGVGDVKMTRISDATVVLHVIVALVLLLALWLMYRLAAGACEVCRGPSASRSVLCSRGSLLNRISS